MNRKRNAYPLKTEKNNHFYKIYKLITLLSNKTIFKLVLICLLMLLNALMELVSLGALYPFLSILSNDKGSEKNYFLLKILEISKINSNQDIVYLMGAIFSIAALFSGLLRVISIKYQIKTSHDIGINFGVEIFRRTLLQPYLIQINKNTSEVISGITSKCNHLIMSGIYPMLVLINSFIFIVAIIATLLIVNSKVTIISISLFTLAYYVIMMVNRKKLTLNSKIVADEGDAIIKILQESLGGIRDVIIDKSDAVYLNAYKKSSRKLQTSIANIQILSSIPRYIVESFGMILIALLACLMIGNSTEDGAVIPILGLLALAAQRMLPLLQQAYSAWSSIVGGGSSFNDALNLLLQPVLKSREESAKPLEFKTDIHFQNVCFAYEGSDKKALNNINLTIKKGSKVGLIGTTGGGKSTLVDCLMGLLPPKTGCLLVDGVCISEENCSGWQANIAHVPQAIFLSDATILENIAYGVPVENIELSRVIEAARSAQILDAIHSMEKGFYEVIGERGIKLSGGQRQRIGLARAFYKRANIIILDEATSALDIGTEEAVMESAHLLDSGITIIMVAHRLATLKNCNEIIRIEGGEIKEIIEVKI